MKKVIIFWLAIFFIPFHAYSQKMAKYTASNGITYKVGDTITIGRGSAPNGDFLYLQIGGWAAVMGHDASKGSDQHNIGRHYSGLAVVIRKIKSYRHMGQEKVYFVVAGGNITNYNLIIEDAIASCEVKNCNNQKDDQQPQSDKFDKLKKLKDLFDQGVLNQEEYDREKAKILNE